MKYLYWGSTALLALMMAAVGVMYFAAQAPADTFEHLGFPDFLRVELGIAKLLGAVALVSPLPRAVKEWAYAGFTITFVSAFLAHLTAGDPASALATPVVALVLLVASYVTYHTYYRAEAEAPAPAGQDVTP